MDRLVMAKESQKNEEKETVLNKNGVVVAPLTEEAIPVSFELAHRLRNKGWSVPPIQMKKKIKNILNSGVEIGAKWVILIGPDEIKSGKAAVKNLDQRSQKIIEIQQVSTYLKENTG